MDILYVQGPGILFIYLFDLPTLHEQVLDGSGLSNSVAQQQPTLMSLVHLLNSITVFLERAGEEKFSLLNKVVRYTVSPRWSIIIYVLLLNVMDK